MNGNRRNVSRAARQLGEFSVLERKLFKATAVAVGDVHVKLRTCAIVVGGNPAKQIGRIS